jgi:hypothetical protein
MVMYSRRELIRIPDTKSSSRNLGSESIWSCTVFSSCDCLKHCSPRSIEPMGFLLRSSSQIMQQEHPDKCPKPGSSNNSKLRRIVFQNQTSAWFCLSRFSGSGKYELAFYSLRTRMHTVMVTGCEASAGCWEVATRLFVYSCQ